MQTRALAGQTRTRRQGRATAAALANFTAAALAAAFDLGGARAGQLRQHIGRQAG